MKFLHSMIRTTKLDKTLDFFVNKLGLIETRRKDHEQGRFTLVFLATEKGEPEIEITFNWDDQDELNGGRNFGHLAFSVDNIYSKCEQLQKDGVTILRPPRDGYMAFIKTPDGISIELLQKGDRLAVTEPWLSMKNQGSW